MGLVTVLILGWIAFGIKLWLGRSTPRKREREALHLQREMDAFWARNPGCRLE